MLSLSERAAIQVPIKYSTMLWCNGLKSDADQLLLTFIAKNIYHKLRKRQYKGLDHLHLPFHKTPKSINEESIPKMTYQLSINVQDNIIIKHTRKNNIQTRSRQRQHREAGTSAPDPAE